MLLLWRRLVRVVVVRVRVVMMVVVVVRQVMGVVVLVGELLLCNWCWLLRVVLMLLSVDAAKRIRLVQVVLVMRVVRKAAVLVDQLLVMVMVVVIVHKCWRGKVSVVVTALLRHGHRLLCILNKV